jgi:hypothetical protein
MTTQTHNNLPGSGNGHEASGLSPEEAERLSAEFRPSWEVEEQQASPGATAPHEVYAAPPEPVRNGDSRNVAAHVPPARVETHEPEVSVIIDRSITAAEMDAQRAGAPARPAPAPAPHVAPVFAAPAPAPQRVAPVLRAPRGADESLELPASLKKSNKGLFLGVGVAVAAAALVFVIRGMSSEPDASSASPATVTTSETPRAAAAPVPPPPPPPAAVAPVPPPPPQPVVTPPPAAAAPVVAQAPAPARPTPAPRPQAAAHAAPPPAPHHAAAPAPRNPPKASGGGIVRDNPF